MSKLVFTSNKAVLKGKQGKLKQDSDGNFEVMVGAYNIPTTSGETYLFTERVKKLFTSSTMLSKFNKNQLYGEADHPSLDDYRLKTRTEAEAVALWINRLRRIDPKNISHQIMGIRWEKLPQVVNGRPVYGVYCIIKPLVPILAKSLSDPEQNTAFSVRSFVNRTMQLGELFCETNDIVTYDWVPHGGIPIATKYSTPSLESEHKIQLLTDGAIITPETINHLAELEASEVLHTGIESGTMFDTVMVRGLAGWKEVPDLGALVSRNW